MVSWLSLLLPHMYCQEEVLVRCFWFRGQNYLSCKCNMELHLASSPLFPIETHMVVVVGSNEEHLFEHLTCLENLIRAATNLT